MPPISLKLRLRDATGRWPQAQQQSSRHHRPGREHQGERAGRKPKSPRKAALRLNTRRGRSAGQARNNRGLKGIIDRHARRPL